ncbi:hypothetical protein HY025_01435 [Candidatus Daviesbacteria bacterium]|nr:hypothetical protein [Candidatus Daviesbacteria bacterium]
MKTLVYSDIFDYPLKAWEIHKWLILKKVTLSQIDKTLKKLVKKKSVGVYKEYYFLKKRQKIVKIRVNKFKESQKFLFQAKLAGQFFKIIPWVKLVGISGSLAMENATSKDDIDLFIITEKNRLFLSRILILAILAITGKRRLPKENKQKSAGKICVNLLLDEKHLYQANKDIYLAHEILQMKVIWQRDNIYSKFLEENAWSFKFLPNWSGSFKNNQVNLKKAQLTESLVLDLLESLVRDWQLKYMQKNQTSEKINNHALYFHPKDCRQEVLNKYNKRIQKL